MIELKNLCKRYGKISAIDNISLKISSPGIYSLLGRNGAGKTTLLKLIAGHIKASAKSSIIINNKAVSTSQMPNNVVFINTGTDLFNVKIGKIIGLMSDLHNSFDPEFAYQMINHFEMDINKRFNQLSFGMKSMLTTIISLSNNADIILLDEPTLGFDAVMRDKFNTLLLKSYQAHPRLIIVSTHLIDEIAKVVEKIIIIDKGQLILETAIDEFDEMAYKISGSKDIITPLLTDLNCINQTKIEDIMIAHIFDKRIEVPDGVNMENLSLQELFISLVGGNKNEI
jgi:ABC-2 type transport system ATP-binding protein